MKILLILAIIVNSLVFLIGLYAIVIPFFLPKENKQLHFVGGTICVLMGFYHVMTFVNSYPNLPDFFNSQSFVF